jgi:hypothetical protein
MTTQTQIANVRFYGLKETDPTITLKVELYDESHFDGTRHEFTITRATGRVALPTDARDLTALALARKSPSIRKELKSLKVNVG